MSKKVTILTDLNNNRVCYLARVTKAFADALSTAPEVIKGDVLFAYKDKTTWRNAKPWDEKKKRPLDGCEIRQ